MLPALGHGSSDHEQHTGLGDDEQHQSYYGERQQAVERGVRLYCQVGDLLRYKD